MIATEQLLGDSPVVVRRRVKWGECDPAGVVYTPIFAEYAVSALMYFLEALLGSPMRERFRDLDFGTPVRALSFDFVRSLYPEQSFDMTVYVREVRNTTFELELRFASEAGDLVCKVALVVICVYYAERKSRTIPDTVRAALDSYRRRCPLPDIPGDQTSPRPA